MSSWRRTYWVVFVSNLITAVGMMSFLPFFPAILEDMGVHDPDARATWSGLCFGAGPLAAAFMGPIWGSIGDRFGRKLMVVRALVSISVFVGAMSFATSPWQLLGLRLGQGIFSGFVPPSITLVSVASPREIQGRVTGSLQAALPTGMILGPLAGAFIQANYGMSSVFTFVSIAVATSAVLVMLFATEDPSLRMTLERFSPTTVLANAMRDLKHILEQPKLRWVLAVLFVVHFGMGTTNPLLQIYVEELWDGDPARVESLTAWLFSAFAVAGVVVLPIWGRLGDRAGHGRMLAVAALLTAASFVAHAAVAAYAWLFVARVGLGVAFPGTNAASFGLAATETAEDRRGGAFAAVFSARAFALSLGAIFGGALCTVLTLPGLFLAAGLTVVLVLAVLQLRGRGEADGGGVDRGPLAVG
jgi:DHA1 family multidrug resistance protein-like MFS transporter